MPRLLDPLRFVVVLASTLFLLPHSTQANFRFAAPYVSYQPEVPSISLATADLNGDGHVDVATADQDNDLVSIFLGEGNGSLTPAGMVAVGDYPNCVRVGDLDQNGTQDLVVACSNSNQVSILWGAGDGTFPNRTDVAAPGFPLSVAVGDLEGSDPYPDFAVATNNGTIWVFRNTGGTIGAPSSLSIIQTAWAISIDDMNVDGHNDIIVSGYYEAKMSVFLGTGNANFDPRITTDVRWPTSSMTAYVNDDAYPDVLAVSDTAFVTLLGNGDGTFTTTPELDGYLSGNTLSAEDFDRDGKLDVVACADGQEGGMLFFKGNGDGTYAPRKDISGGPGGHEILAEDLDEDNRLDLLFVGTGLETMPGYGDGTFGLTRFYKMGYAPGEVRTGDLNGDGRPDLVVLDRSSSGGFTLRLGELGGFGPKVDYLGAGPTFAAEFGDINGDGAQDILLGCNPNLIKVYLGNGDGTFDNPSSFVNPAVPTSFASGDLNQDGFDDLVAASTNSNVSSVWLGHADGTLQLTDGYPAGAPVLIGDFDEDGKLDLVGSEQFGAWFFPGNGDGSFGSGVETYYSIPPAHMVSGDLNGDGHLDLVADSGGEFVSTLLGSGQGTFQETQYFVITYATIAQTDIADLDLDGIPDVCFADVFSAGVRLFHGNGDGTLVNTQNLGIGRYVNGATIADFDQNGAPDIAVTADDLHQGIGPAFILYNLINAQVAVEPPAEAPVIPMRLLANPARGYLSVQVNLKTDTAVRLEVLDLAGRRVAVPMNGFMPAGSHTLTWRGESETGLTAPSGVYVIRLTSGGRSRATKAVWLRN